MGHDPAGDLPHRRWCRLGQRCVTASVAEATQVAWRDGRSAVALEEVEGGPVKGLGILVQARVRQVIEDHEFTAGDRLADRLGEALRADQATVTKVGTPMSPSTWLQSCPMAASVWARNASSGWAGRLRTNCTKVSTKSGRWAYISGVKHSGKIASITVSATVGRDRA